MVKNPAYSHTIDALISAKKSSFLFEKK